MADVSHTLTKKHITSPNHEEVLTVMEIIIDYWYIVIGIVKVTSTMNKNNLITHFIDNY